MVEILDEKVDENMEKIEVFLSYISGYIKPSDRDTNSFI